MRIAAWRNALMPANLTPQYKKAEEEFRKAQTPREQVECLEQMLALIPKHKGTEKLQAELRSRLKEAKSELEAEKKAHKRGKSFKIPRQGAGQVVLVGAANAGKSRILAELTHAKPEVAPYPFTTREPMPGMMPWQDVAVQLVDTPPIMPGHLEGYLPGLVRAADLVLLCLDGSSDDAPEQTEYVVTTLQSKKTHVAVDTGFDDEDFGIVRIKSLLVVTHADDAQAADRLEFFRELVRIPFETQMIELDRRDSVEALRDRIYNMLQVIRVYTKVPGKPPDYSAPYALARGATVEDLALKIHKDLAGKLKFARIWGTGTFDGQSVGPQHVLHERDLVELHS
jgi:ribosome-interacting GTPase 1